ncbi:hypothetical protein Plhal304r1_c020g0071851 [Plasmopara halstedii]
MRLRTTLSVGFLTYSSEADTARLQIHEYLLFHVFVFLIVILLFFRLLNYGYTLNSRLAVSSSITRLKSSKVAVGSLTESL